MEFHPQHMLDLLKCTNPNVMSRMTWLALSRGGEVTSIACEWMHTALGRAEVRIVVGSKEYIEYVPSDAIVEIPTTPTIKTAADAVEHAELPRKTFRGDPQSPETFEEAAGTPET